MVEPEPEPSPDGREAPATAWAQPRREAWSSREGQLLFALGADTTRATRPSRRSGGGANAARREAELQRLMALQRRTAALEHVRPASDDDDDDDDDDEAQALRHPVGLGLGDWTRESAAPADVPLRPGQEHRGLAAVGGRVNSRRRPVRIARPAPAPPMGPQPPPSPNFAFSVPTAPRMDPPPPSGDAPPPGAERNQPFDAQLRVIERATEDAVVDIFSGMFIEDDATTGDPEVHARYLARRERVRACVRATRLGRCLINSDRVCQWVWESLLPAACRLLSWLGQLCGNWRRLVVCCAIMTAASLLLQPTTLCDALCNAHGVCWASFRQEKEPSGPELSECPFSAECKECPFSAHEDVDYPWLYNPDGTAVDGTTSITNAPLILMHPSTAFGTLGLSSELSTLGRISALCPSDKWYQLLTGGGGRGSSCGHLWRLAQQSFASLSPLATVPKDVLAEGDSTAVTYRAVVQAAPGERVATLGKLYYAIVRNTRFHTTADLFKVRIHLSACQSGYCTGHI